MEWTPALENVIDHIPGMLHPGQAEWLFLAARALDNYATILEIGAYRGKSTAALAYGCVDSHKRIYTIDTFRGLQANTDEQGDCFLHEFLDNMQRYGLLAYVTPLVGRSDQYYATWNQWGKQIDLLWVDGCHTYETVRADLDAFFNWLKPTGILAMHDVWGRDGGDDRADRAWRDYLPRLDPDSIHHDHNLAWGRKR